MNDNYIFPFLWMRGEPEEIIREEIARIAECGIRAVCVEARPHKDFCGPGWWHDMDIVLDEAKKRDMRIWILDDKHFPTGYANGLIEKHPERKKQYIACTTADIFGASRPLTLNIQRMLKPTIGFWEIGNPVDYEEQARNTLVAAVALRYEEGHVFHEDTVDLTDLCKDGKATFTLPEGQWRVHVIYRTRTGGGDPNYIIMIDKVTAHTHHQSNGKHADYRDLSLDLYRRNELAHNGIEQTEEQETLHEPQVSHLQLPHGIGEQCRHQYNGYAQPHQFLLHKGPTTLAVVTARHEVTRYQEEQSHEKRGINRMEMPYQRHHLLLPTGMIDPGRIRGIGLRRMMEHHQYGQHDFQRVKVIKSFHLSVSLCFVCNVSVFLFLPNKKKSRPYTISPE